MWRGLGHQAGHAAATIAGDVVPDDFHTTFRDRERDGRFEVFQTVATGDQAGVGGIALDGGKYVSRHGGTTMGRIHRHFVGFRVTLEHRVLARCQLVLVLVDILRGDGEQGLLAAIRVGQEAFAVNGTGVLGQGFPGRDRTIGIARHFRAHRRQALAQLVRFSCRDRGHDTGRQQRQPQYPDVQQILGHFHFLFVLKKQCLEVHAEAERDEITVIHGGVLAVEEVGVVEACGVGVLVFGIEPQADRFTTLLEVAARAWRVTLHVMGPGHVRLEVDAGDGIVVIPDGTTTVAPRGWRGETLVVTVTGSIVGRRAWTGTCNGPPVQEFTGTIGQFARAINRVTAITHI
ncbi:hypothetical protein D3C78_1067310 [compost metagenome]